MPFASDFRCSAVIVGSNRGPPFAAAAMWLATPTFATRFSLLEGPTVIAPQLSKEQKYPVRIARIAFVLGLNSSRELMFGDPHAEFAVVQTR
jgi:hypothetical protein